MTLNDLRDRHGDPLEHVSRVPRTATEVYYRWTGAVPRRSLTRRERNERRSLARYLQHLSTRGVLIRGVVTTRHGQEYVAFWRETVDADAARAHTPPRAAHSAAG